MSVARLRVCANVTARGLSCGTGTHPLLARLASTAAHSARSAIGAIARGVDAATAAGSLTNRTHAAPIRARLGGGAHGVARAAVIRRRLHVDASTTAFHQARRATLRPRLASAFVANSIGRANDSTRATIGRVASNFRANSAAREKALRAVTVPAETRIVERRTQVARATGRGRTRPHGSGVGARIVDLARASHQEQHEPNEHRQQRAPNSRPRLIQHVRTFRFTRGARRAPVRPWLATSNLLTLGARCPVNPAKVARISTSASGRMTGESARRGQRNFSTDARPLPAFSYAAPLYRCARLTSRMLNSPAREGWSRIPGVRDPNREIVVPAQTRH